MVRAEHLREDFCGFQSGSQQLRDDKIVDTPTDISSASVRPKTPPRIVPVTLLELAEGIDKARIDNCVEVRSFLIRKSSVFPIRLWVGQVVFCMRNIQVPAKYDWLRFFQRLHPSEKGFIPFPPVG